MERRLQDELDLGWLDYGARMYMPDIGRWGVIDAMTDAIPSITSYNYTLNNPVRLIDPNGMWSESSEGGITTTDPDEISNFLNALKVSAKRNTADAITTSAEYAHNVYNDLSATVQENPELLDVANFTLGIASKGVEAFTNKDPNSMSWGDLLNIWLFELGDYNDADKPIRFGANARTTKDLQGQEGVQIAKNKALSALRQGQTSVTSTWEYGQKQFYDGASQGDVATSFLGSYTTVVSIVRHTNGTATFNYTVSNTTGWESGTRLRKAAKPGGQHQAIIPDKARGEGINLGGNVKQVWTWSETVPVSK